METIKINIDTNAPKATDNMKVFRNEIKELRSQLIGLTEGTEEYNQVLGELANKQFQLREMNENVRYSVTDLGEQLGTVSRIASGVASGFSAVQATMTLFGAESENLQKTMVKLQSAMALVQGLQGLEDLGKQLGRAKIQFSGTIKSVKGFITALSGVKKALIATGIGAFVVLIGTLAANWDKVTKALGFNTEEQKKQAEEAKKAAEEQENALNRIGNAASKPLTQFVKLRQGYQSLKTDAQRTQWIKDNASAFEELGLSVKGIVDAENIFINNTDDYVNAIITRAMATAKEEELAELAAKAAREKTKADDKYSKYKPVKAGDKSYGGSHTTEGGYEYVDRNGVWRLTEKGAKRENDINKSLTYGAYRNTVNEMEKVANEIVKISESVSGKLVKTTKTTSSTTTSTAEDAAKKAKDIAEKARLALITEEDEKLKELERVYLEEKELLESQNIDTTNLTAKYEQDKTKIQEEFAEKRAKVAADEAKKQLEIAKAQYDAQIDNLEFALAEIQNKFDIDSIKKELAEGNLFNFKFETPEEEFNRIKQFNQDVYDSTLEILKAEEQQLNAQLSMYAVGTAERIELENQITKNKRLQTQERYNLEYNNYQAEVNLQARRNALLESSVDSISNIFSTVSDLYEDNTAEQKGFAIASAVLDTIASAVKSFKNLGGWPTGLIGIASSLATGYAQIKSLLSVNPNGDNAESVLASDTPNVTSTIIPNEILSNALGTSSEINLQDELAAAQKATKVYVLESDITDAQNTVKTQVEESTF